MKQTNYKPELFIDTTKIDEEELLKNFYDEITNKETGYSITPTTFKARKFFKSPDEPIFIEEYGFKENFVTRFGINIHNKKIVEQLGEELAKHNNQLKGVIEKRKIEKLGKIEEKSISNISGVDDYKHFLKHIELTQYENSVLNEAIKYMNIKSKKLVLVDTFPRTSKVIDDIPMGGINTYKLDIHTVLLYKADEGKILAIDPNNPMFSTHLNKHESMETLCSTSPEHKIYSRPEKSTTGFASNKYRDCIDIAAKLGLLLNLEKEQYKSIESIMKSNAIKLVTNNPLLDGLKFKNEELIRTKQSSNIEKVILINEKMKEISEKITKEDLEYKEKIKVLEEQHFLALNELTHNKIELIGKAQSEYLNDYLSDDF